MNTITTATTQRPPVTRQPATPQQEANVKDLARLDLIHLSGSENDDYGAPMSAYDALKALNQGQPVTVEHPVVGTYEKGRYPENSSKWFVGTRPTESNTKAAATYFARERFHGEGVTLRSPAELDRYLAACGLTGEGNTALTPEENEASGLLRKYEGTRHGEFKVILSEDDFNYGYYYTARPERTDEKPGLYNPNHRVGGFLGLGSREDRLTPYEALNLLSQGQSVHIVGREGQGTVASFEDLKTFDRLR